MKVTYKDKTFEIDQINEAGPTFAEDSTGKYTVAYNGQLMTGFAVVEESQTSET